MDDGVTDYPSWGETDLMTQADTEFDFVTVEEEYGSLHYGGCVQNCQDPTRWMVGTIDSMYGGIGTNAASTRTSDGIAVAYEDWQGGTGRVKVGTCGGVCFLKTSWQLGVVRTGLLGSQFGTHSRALAADPSGGLDLLYRGAPNGSSGIEYARCASACTDSASWQSTVLDSGIFLDYDDALTVAPSGTIHVLIEGGPGLTYLTCDSACTSRANWSSVQLDTGEVGATPSIQVGPNNALYVTYGSRSSGLPIRFATCSIGCLDPANWSLTKLPANAGRDISMILDAAGQPWVATSYGISSYYDGKSVVLHCPNACTNGPSWSSMTIDSLGDARDIAMALDITGQPRILVSGTGVHYAQRPDTTVLIH